MFREIVPVFGVWQEDRELKTGSDLQYLHVTEPVDWEYRTTIFVFKIGFGEKAAIPATGARQIV